VSALIGLGAVAWASRRDVGRSARPAVSVADLAKAVASPGIAPVLDLPAGEIAATEERLRPAERMNASGYVHALHLFGPSLRTPTGALGDGPVAVADLLLDVPRAVEMFGGGSILSATRYGLRAPISQESLLGTDQSAAMAHRGQYLAVLGGLGVAAERPIRLADGSTRPVAALRDDLMANFALDGEIAWDAVALAYYIVKPTWTNKFGHVFTFDQLAGELDSRDPGQASCGGTHDLTALTTLIKVDRLKPILSDAGRDRAIAAVSRRVAHVRDAQLGDGSWDLRWHRGAPTGAAGRATSSPYSSGDSLIVTGHLLEWLILLPEPLRPEAEVYRRGATWVAAALRAFGDDPARVDKLYCPLIHATRSLRLLSRAVEPSVGP